MNDDCNNSIIIEIVDTYQELLKSELQPNAITHKVAVLGYMLQEVTTPTQVDHYYMQSAPCILEYC